jgi:prophage maintenance system killer protein
MYIVNENNYFTIHDTQENLDGYLDSHFGIPFENYLEFQENGTRNGWYEALGIIVNIGSEISQIMETPFLERHLQSLVLLNQYDSNTIPFKPLKSTTDTISLTDTLQLIKDAKTKLIALGEASGLFGQDKDGRLSGIIQNVYQTFGGECLYTTINQRAAFLFYSIVKNHPFSDGNKRIGALLFLNFLEKNRIDKQDGVSKFNHSGIVALTILIAHSNAADKDLIVNLISNMIG